jgi:fatty-acyl-CoA synthase
MIIRGGENIYPREIRQLLYAHRESPTRPSSGCPTMTGASRSRHLSGQPPGTSVMQDELASWCRARQAAHETPRHWVFVDAFPLGRGTKARSPRPAG